MVTSEFWIEVEGPLGTEGLLHQSSCRRAPHRGDFPIGGFRSYRDAAGAALDYIRSVSACPRCCPRRRWVASRLRGGILHARAGGATSGPWPAG